MIVVGTGLAAVALVGKFFCRSDGKTFFSYNMMCTRMHCVRAIRIMNRALALYLLIFKQKTHM